MATCDRCTGIYLEDGCLYALPTIRLMISSPCLGCSFFLRAATHHNVSVEDVLDAQVFLRRPSQEEDLVHVLFVTIEGSYTTMYVRHEFWTRLCSANGFETPFWINYEGEHTSYLGRLVSEHSGNDECLDLAKAWFERCTRSHGALCSLEKDVALPTRLVYIPPNHPSQLKLCITQGMRGQYVTLSYCWGTGISFKTVSANIEKLKAGFAASILPKTLRDAVRLAHIMGFDWIWIDSLCIKQDDSKDWSLESSQMAQVYGNAAFTICADSSRGADDGIFKERDVLQSHHFGTDLNYCLQILYEPWNNMPRQSLYLRGWAFQERLLSSRNLHFLDGQIAWECNTTLYGEEFRGRHSHPEQHFSKNRFTEFYHQQRLRATANSAEPDLLALIGAWNYAIQEMAVRELSYTTDRFPAVSGLASAIQTPELGEYFAGIWSCNPFLSMAWFTRWPQSHPQQYISPSWSWAWTRLQIVWHTNTYGEDNPPGPDDLTDWKAWDQAYGPRLVEQNMNYKGSDPKGEILEGSYLLMTGYCRTVYVIELPDTDFDYNFKEVAWATGGKNELGRRVCMDMKTDNWDSVSSFNEDFSDVESDIEVKNSKEYICVQIARERKEKVWNPKILALVIESVNDADVQTFRRVGLLIFDDAQEGKWAERTLKLI